MLENVKLTGFGADDKITFTGVTQAVFNAAVSFSSNAAGDVTISYADAASGATLNKIVLAGVSGDADVVDLASFNAPSLAISSSVNRL